MKISDNVHLTYCTAIHSGESWEEVKDDLGKYLPRVREQLSWSGPFGVGLRLSARAAQVLEQEDKLSAFRALLASHDAYVFTINGFPYGNFHGRMVKESVYRPDWREPSRLEYTNRLARILASLLPDEEGLEGSVSTVPLAFAPDVTSPGDLGRIVDNLLLHVAELHRLRAETGRTITLALEPEPWCYLETVDDTVTFFREQVRQPRRIGDLAIRLGISREQAAETMERHLGVCYDACHLAVQFEKPADALARLEAARIKVCKFQISSALKLAFREGDGRASRALSPFRESIYLHQVVERSQGRLRRYRDLPDGLAAEESHTSGDKPGCRKEWRVHCHVPIFLENGRDVATTQDHLTDLLRCLPRAPHSHHLEVETYTWEILPPEYRMTDLADSIARELDWVRTRIAS